MIRAPILLATAACAMALFACARANARQITAHDRSVIEQINRERNRYGYDASKRDCNWFANSKALALLQAGFSPADLRIGILTDERGLFHAVTEVVGVDDKGSPVDLVLDNHWPWPTPRRDLEAYGYRWIASPGISQ